ncbi:MAG: M1 family metallopeptidase [Chloroflexi bacterium]|nr:M1 family metallopeptidase [Chloroflexota bacterium]MCC6897014.1 M1 family metallopeptidase [Anaerolineae bacterium]
MRISRVISSLIFLMLTACAFMQGTQVTLTPTQTPIPLPQGTPVPTRERELHPIQTPSQAAVEPTLDQPMSCTTENAPPTYTVRAELNYAKRALKVSQRIRYTNASEESLTSLVLSVKPNGQAGVFSLQSINIIVGESAQYTLAGQRMEVSLPEALEPDCSLEISLNFDLRLQAIDIGGARAYQGYLGYSDRQTNLGQWLPVVAIKQGDSWITHEEVSIGEQEILDVANWDIRLSITDAPNTLRVAAPGSVEKISDSEWHLTMLNARDYSLSIGENYRLNQAVTPDNVTVELYTFDDAIITSDTGSMDTAAYALNTALKSLSLYEAVFGDYPLDRLVMVEADFPDGMEFSGIVFVGGEYFRGLSGVESYLTLISVHEIAHQWWYSRVGNDQALHPWLDEALATYSEFIFIEKFYPTLTDWWWDFRVNRLLPQGFVDSTVYEFTSRRAYINAIYLRGVLMLHDLRQTLGDDVFFGWLNRYASTGSGRVMSPEDFWSLLTPEQLERTKPIRERYLQKPQIISLATPECTAATCTP